MICTTASVLLLLSPLILHFLFQEEYFSKVNQSISQLNTCLFIHPFINLANIKEMPIMCGIVIDIVKQQYAKHTNFYPHRAYLLVEEGRLLANK